MHWLSEVVRPVTLIKTQRLSDRLGVDILLASETFQITGSFKFRAAYNLASKVQQTHLIAASSGNFGQALAYACSLLGKQCHIVMPQTSTKTKIEAVREYGGNVELIDPCKVSRSQKVQELARIFPDAYVASAFDDDLVIEGNATLAIEIAESGYEFDALIAPVGGGGLTSGLVQGFRNIGVKKPVWGAEPAIANDASRSLTLGRLVANEAEPQTLADGARTLSLGKRNFEILQTGLEEVFEVSERSIRSAVKDLFLYANLKAEPTGALSIGALSAHKDRFQGQKVCCVISGGNVDPETYTSLL